MKASLDLAADTASVAKLDLFKFVPFRLNRQVAEFRSDLELAQSIAITKYLDETASKPLPNEAGDAARNNMQVQCG